MSRSLLVLSSSSRQSIIVQLNELYKNVLAPRLLRIGCTLRILLYYHHLMCLTVTLSQ
jgi:hypothetical protein